MKTCIRIVFVFLLFLFITACNTSPESVEENPAAIEIDPSAGVNLSVSASNERPAAGETVVLTVRVTPREEMQGAELLVDLPEDAQFANGRFSWQGDLLLNEPQTFEIAVQAKNWPLSEPVKITLTNNISTFWTYWPDANQSNMELESQPIQSMNSDSFVGAEPMPSVAVTLAVTPADPEPGQLTQFSAHMLAQSDFTGVQATFELPPAFQVEPGSSLTWEGDLVRGVEQTVELLATPNEVVEGEARFVLNTFDYETITAAHLFGPDQIVEPVYRPEGLFAEADDAEPEFVPDVIIDEEAPAPDAAARPAPLPLVDFTVVERESDGNQETFTVFVFANADISNGRISIILPPTYGLVDGTLTWQGNLAANERMALEIVLERQSQDPTQLEIQFASDQGEVAPFIHQLVLPDESSATEPDGANEPTGTFNLSGRFLYDENLNPGTAARGMYYIRVEVYEDDSGFEGGDDFVCNDTTDGNGYWSCTGSASDVFDDTVELYARARAYNSNYGSVREPDGDEYRFVTTNHNMSESGGSYNFGSWWPGNQGGNPQDGAFHILKMGTYANTTTRNLGGEIPPISGQAHFVTFRWPDTDSDNSSEYSNWMVRIEGPGSTDPDEWDESVIMHEYGHYLMDHFAVLGSVSYCNDPGEVPPNCGHSFNSHEDAQTAYIEGYADYYQSAVKRYYGMANAHLYEETTWNVNLETSWHAPTITWDDAESTIAGILWDLNDAPNDDQDGDNVGDELNENHQEIHDTFSDNPGGYGTPITIHGFYNSFRSRYAWDNELIRIYYEHGIDKDSVSPSGSMNINSNATYATSTAVTLNLSASDPYPGTGVTQVRMQNSGGSWSSWQSYAVTKNWTLSSANGTKTVYVQFRDGSGNVSSTVSDSIILDTIDPSNPASLWSSSHTPSVWSNDPTVTVYWAGATDNVSGVYGYGLYWDTLPTSPPAQIVDTTGTTDTSSALSTGNSWYFHLITRDNAGNWTNSPVHLGPFYIDTIDPVSAVDALPRSQCLPFPVSWGGSDAHSGVATYDVQYREGSGGSWQTWLSATNQTSAMFGPPLAITGGETYYFRVRARDVAGNVESYPRGDGDASTMILHCVYLPFVTK